METSWEDRFLPRLRWSAAEFCGSTSHLADSPTATLCGWGGAGAIPRFIVFSWVLQGNHQFGTGAAYTVYPPHQFKLTLQPKW